jgi:hypothetical protein
VGLILGAVVAALGGRAGQRVLVRELHVEAGRRTVAR